MGVETHLRQKERIVSRFGPYYATSTRLILHLERNGVEKLHELPYSQIDKIDEVRTSNHSRMMVGGIVTIVSIIASYSLNMITPLLGVVAGGFLVLHGSIGGPAYYQVHGRDVPREQMHLWQIRYRGAGSLIASIRTIKGEHV